MKEMFPGKEERFTVCSSATNGGKSFSSGKFVKRRRLGEEEGAHRLNANSNPVPAFLPLGGLET